jgi:type VI secretion system protein ImpH
MADDPRFGWQRRRSVEDWLYSEPYRFEFCQAVRLLESFRPHGLLGDGNRHREPEVVRFRSRVSFDFPASEIHELELVGGTPRMTVNFLGLAGALGPLPAPYSEMILAAAARKDHAAADFLDIFNHRLVLLFYRVKQAHSPALTARAPHEGSAAQYLFSLIGLNLPAMRKRLGIPAQSLLQYAGLLAGMPRSVAGLERMLADYFTVRVRVRQFIGGWRWLDRSQWTAIGAGGSNRELGAGAVLGRRVWDDEKSVSIVIGPLSWSVFLEFLPEGTRHRELAALARFYLGPHRAEARLFVNAAEVPQAAIGQSRLGYTSWLLRQTFKGANPSVRIALEN